MWVYGCRVRCGQESRSAQRFYEEILQPQPHATGVTVSDKGLDKLVLPRGAVTPLLHAILGETDFQR
jgi:hypothetical protein